MRLALFIDFETGTPTGIGRYGIELLRALADLGEEPEVWLDRSFLAGWRANGIKGLPVRSYGWPRRLTSRTRPFVWGALSRPEVVHSPGNIVPPVPPSVLRSTSIHDMSPFTQPGLKAPDDGEVWRSRIRHSVSVSRCILASSASTRDDLLSVFPECAGRTYVCPLGVDHLGGGEGLARRPGRGGHILAVGTVEPRKNLEGLFEAYALLSAGDGDLPPLVVAGGDGFQAGRIKSVPCALGIGDRVTFTGYIPESALRTLFEEASCLVHPALSEGFGFTVPEAFSWGLPVAASDRASLGEFFSGAAHMFDPGDAGSIARGIALCLSQGVTDSQMEERRRIFATMTWKDCARTTLGAFRAALEDRDG